jgi:hypothetical protein
VWGTRDGTEYIHVLFSLFGRFFGFFFDFTEMLLTKFHIIWPSGFRGKAVLEIEQ